MDIAFILFKTILLACMFIDEIEENLMSLFSWFTQMGKSMSEQ